MVILLRRKNHNCPDNSFSFINVFLFEGIWNCLLRSLSNEVVEKCFSIKIYYSNSELFIILNSVSKYNEMRFISMTNVLMYLC